MNVLAALAIGGAAATADPYQIFAHARSVWAAQHYPAYMTYVVAVNVTENGVPKAKHYHLAYDAQAGKISVNPVSDEEAAAPPDPNGMTFHIIPRRNFKQLMDKRVGNPGEAVDYLGVPMIAPTYSFGLTLAGEDEVVGSAPSGDALVQEIRKEFNDPTPAARLQQALASGGTKTIASVTSTLRRYVVTLAGMDSVAGAQCYHLKLKPAAEPERYRLRELWVDATTFETRQLITAGNFTGSAVPWLVTFADQNGAEYIVSETALAPVGVGDHRYQQATISFQNVAEAPRPARPTSFFVTKENVMTEPDTQRR